LKNEETRLYFFTVFQTADNMSHTNYIATKMLFNAITKNMQHFEIPQQILITIAHDMAIMLITKLRNLKQ
jgi:hypothetical protein